MIVAKQAVSCELIVAAGHVGVRVDSGIRVAIVDVVPINGVSSYHSQLSRERVTPKLFKQSLDRSIST